MTAPTNPELIDPALTTAVEVARAAALETAGDEVGEHVGIEIEDEAAVTHLFDAVKPGYRGWRWAVTVASGGPDHDVTVSEVTLLPGPDALVAPEWVPWQDRVRAGDLGVGDLMPTAPDDPRLVPAYLASDDPSVEATATEVGFGRVRVMSRPARLDAAERWHGGEFGPRSDMARGAPARCGTCGFYLPVAGSLSAAFGVCGNEISPADGHLVHTEYGCGAHSEAEVEQVSPVLVADLIYDDAQLDVTPITPPAPATQPPPAAATPRAEPAAEAAPTEATETPEPAPAESVESVDAVDAEAPAAESMQATEPVTEAVPAEPSELAQPAGPETQAAQAESAQQAEPVAETAEPEVQAAPPEPVQPAEPAAQAAPAEPADRVEPQTQALPAESMPPAEPAEAAERQVHAAPAESATDEPPAEVDPAEAAESEPAAPETQAAEAESAHQDGAAGRAEPRSAE